MDGHNKGRWQGRTRTDKLVFFDPTEDDGVSLGDVLNVRITRTTPWSLQGKARTAAPA